MELVSSGRGNRTVTSDAALDDGLLEGSVEVKAGAQFVVRGQIHGSIHTAGDVVIEGWHQGSLHIKASGSVTVPHGGHTQGSIHNEGRLEVYGELSGPVDGAGETYIDPAARVATPRRVGNTTFWEFG